jgi:hypothetical protein
VWVAALAELQEVQGGLVDLVIAWCGLLVDAHGTVLDRDGDARAVLDGGHGGLQVVETPVASGL